MKIVSKVALILSSCAVVLGGTAFAATITQSQFDNMNIWTDFTCAPQFIDYKERYVGDYGLYLGYLNNPSSNTNMFFPWSFKIGINDASNYFLYNYTVKPNGTQRLLDFNKDYFNTVNWAISPGQYVRTLTTAEEIAANSFSAPSWTFNQPHFPDVPSSVLPDHISFLKPNYRVINHPSTPSQGTDYDVEYKWAILYNYGPDLSWDNGLGNGNEGTVVKCMRYQIRWCGDGILQSNKEECDGTAGVPAGYSCNANCELEQDLNPTCFISLSTHSLEVGESLMVNCNGSDVTQGRARAHTTNAFPRSAWSTNLPMGMSYTYNAAGTYNPQCEVRAADGTTVTCSETVTVAQGPQCGDGNVDAGEQCDDGNTTDDGNGCSADCQLLTPSCTLVATPPSGPVALTTTFSETNALPWVSYLNLAFGDGQSQDSPSFALDHTYNTVSAFTAILTVENNYAGQISGTRPEATCSTIVTVNSLQGACTLDIEEDYACTNPDGTVVPSPIHVNYDIDSLPNTTLDTNVPGIDVAGGGAVELLQNLVEDYYVRVYDNNNDLVFECVDHIDLEPCDEPEVHVDMNKALTQPGISFGSGDEVGFVITITNTGSDWVHGLYVTDYMSPLLDYDRNYATENINMSTVTVTTGIDVGDPYNLRWITFSNISMAPNSTARIYLTGTMYSHLCNWPNAVTLSGDVLPEDIDDLQLFPCGPIAEIEKWQSTGTDFTQELIQVQAGDPLNYRIDFANIGGYPTTGGVIISDYLPEGITYVSSEIYVYTNGIEVMPDPLYMEQGTVGNQDYIIYSGFDLESRQSGYVMIYGEVSNDLSYERYENNATIEFASPYQSGTSNTVIAVRDVDMNVDFEKIVADDNGNDMQSGGVIPYFFAGDEIRFDITITNLADMITGVIVDDIWPDANQDCVRYGGWTSTDTNRSRQTNTWRWNYGAPLYQNESTTLTLTGTIVSTGTQCLGQYVNTGNLRYYLDGDLYTGVDEARFEIRESSMLLRKTADTTDVVPGSEITFQLYFENDGSSAISNFVLRDIWPATMDLMPSLSHPHPHPYQYIGPGNPTFTPPQAIDGGWELTWNRGSFDIEPGMTGVIILTGVVLEADEAIERYLETH